jgi:hypothetical protein
MLVVYGSLFPPSLFHWFSRAPYGPNVRAKGVTNAEKVSTKGALGSDFCLAGLFSEALPSTQNRESQN